MNITLAKPVPGSDGPRAAHKGERFDRGERIILVDGERWGRTFVSWRGCHGTVTSFEQEGGKRIGITSKAGYFHETIVTSASKRHAKQFIGGEYRLPDDFKTTETLVVDKVRQLIADGMLRAPSVVKAEAEARWARWEAEREKREKIEESAFRAKACEALGINDIDQPSDVVDRVIAAMRWAQKQ